MAFHVFWPASACLTLFIVGVIMVLIKYGPQICGRGQIYSRRRYDEDDPRSKIDVVEYAREVSDSVA